MSPDEQADFLGGLRKRMEELADLIDAPRDLLPSVSPQEEGSWLSTYWREADDGDDHDGWYLALMKNEGGQEWELAEVALDHSDYVLFTVFKSLTWELAKQRSATASSQGENRLRWFAAQEALLHRINHEWASQARSEHERIIRPRPHRKLMAYVDGSLLQEGLSRYFDRIVCVHMCGLLVRSYERWPRWFPQHEFPTALRPLISHCH